MPPSQNFDIHVDVDAREIRTRGLATLGAKEIHLSRPPLELEEAGFSLVRTLGEYSVSDGRRIKIGDKLAHGYWVVALQSRHDGDLDVFESTTDGSDYVRGADLTLRYWKEQSDMCRRLTAAFTPPRPDQKAAVSAGVLEGAVPVSGVRYPAPSHMSGWYLTTQAFSGDVKELRVEHLYHVTARRPDLVAFLALPPGFRIEVGAQGGTAAFDARALKDA